MYKYLLEEAELSTKKVEVVKEVPSCCTDSCTCQDEDSPMDSEDFCEQCDSWIGDCDCDDYDYGDDDVYDDGDEDGDYDDDEDESPIPDTSGSIWQNHISVYRQNPTDPYRSDEKEVKSQLDILKARYASFDPNN